jgi:NAD(P)-dependent dehydrogenase (short-subunit alcohol dehydrogenase family)
MEMAAASRPTSYGNVPTPIRILALVRIEEDHGLDGSRFTGKVALVTGSTQGIGEAAARRMAAEGAAGIVITGRNEERGRAVRESIAGTGADVLFVQADLADVVACRRLIAATDEHFGRLDVLVNAAAITYRGSIVDTTAELFDSLMAVNVRAPLLLIQGAVEIMRREGIAGSIVTVGSVAAHGSFPVLLPYAMTKGALVPMTRNLAYSLMWDRIRVNLLQPGWMDTPGEDAIQRAAHGAGDDWLEKAEAQQPFGRLIKPHELAAAIAFLASDEAGVMTGAVIDYDQSVPTAGIHGKPTPGEAPR